MLTLEKIENSINFMDDTYDANFGEWIRNEDNCRIVAYNMKKYVNKYSTSNMIVAIKWIVKDWTLKSIIIFTKKMIIEDIKGDIDNQLEKIKIISGLIYTWNPLFISEFILATTKNFMVDEKIKFLNYMLESFEYKKINEIFKQLDNKLELKVKNEIMVECRLKRRRLKRSKSIIEAYNVS
ncbi:protein with wd40 repeat [Vairimorpha apis BRL 01]|uniref:Protein with wd40 repeat n=1 Tax=Vairimorpha apis BRL 01 TaxID=1037528 RepID=T0LC88_9MICR|nr:protein with wd40 repeat [Vairimorpha apis BRL 01]